MNTYQDFFLKFSSREEAEAVLFDGTGEDQRPKYAAVDVIGIIFKPTGEMLLGEDGQYPEMAPIDGWHANVRHTDAAPELAAYQVFPETPERVWA